MTNRDRINKYQNSNDRDNIDKLFKSKTPKIQSRKKKVKKYY